MIGYFCTALVGLVFLATGTLKAIDARSFRRQVSDYGVSPVKRARAGALLFIGFEYLLGAGLLVGLSRLLLPIAAAFLVALTALTLWASATGRTEDCGCYGGELLLTPRQSALLNLAYMALLGAGWYLAGFSLHGAAESSASFPIWKAGTVLAAGIAGVMLARRSLRRGPLLDVSMLKAGRRWRKGWLPADAADLQRGSYFVVFLSKDCPYCKQWIPFLNVIHVQAGMPQVLGVMSLGAVEKQAFLEQHTIHFPVVTIFSRLVTLLADSYPTAALVEDGVIREKWVGQIPRPYLERIREFYEGLGGLSASGASGFSG